MTIARISCWDRYAAARDETRMRGRLAGAARAQAAGTHRTRPPCDLGQDRSTIMPITELTHNNCNASSVVN